MKKGYKAPEAFVYQMMGESIMKTDTNGHLDGGEALSKEDSSWEDIDEGSNFSGPNLWNEDEMDDED